MSIWSIAVSLFFLANCHETLSFPCSENLEHHHKQIFKPNQPHLYQDFTVSLWVCCSVHKCWQCKKKTASKKTGDGLYPAFMCIYIYIYSPGACVRIVSRLSLLRTTWIIWVRLEPTLQNKMKAVIVLLVSAAFAYGAPHPNLKFIMEEVKCIHKETLKTVRHSFSWVSFKFCLGRNRACFTRMVCF